MKDGEVEEEEKHRKKRKRKIRNVGSQIIEKSIMKNLRENESKGEKVL